MKRTTILTLSIIVLILLLAGVGTYFFLKIPRDAQNSEANKALATNVMQAFTTLQGEPLDLSVYKGKIRVVNSWASWSPFSATELVDLEKLATDYKSKNVVVIAINRKENKEQASRFLKSIGTFPDIVFAIDVNDTYYASVGGYAMPETVFYDVQGNVVEHYRGNMTNAQMNTFLQQTIDASK